MKHPILLLLLLALGTASAVADEQTRTVQAELKKQGFYFGEVDGAAGSEFSAAIKRYQIRNGLEVTGQSNEETLGALGLSGSSASAPSKPAPVARATPRPAPVAPRSPATSDRPRVDLRRDDADAEGDRRALREEAPPTYSAPRDRSIIPPPASMDRSPVPQTDYRYRELFEATPYANAPRPLQEQTLRAAQRMLGKQGLYRGAPDGQPGPETEGALLDFQHDQRLRPTGRLDLDTLNALHLLPGPSTENPALQPFTAPGRPSERRTYRGVWVH